jgi:hypothetical protein
MVKETHLKEARRYGPVQKLMSTTKIVIGIETVIGIASILFKPIYELGEAGRNYLTRRHYISHCTTSQHVEARAHWGLGLTFDLGLCRPQSFAMPSDARFSMRDITECDSFEDI